MIAVSSSLRETESIVVQEPSNPFKKIVSLR
jgi:hypothetical protein